MVTISRFISLTHTDAEGIDHTMEQWLDSLAVEPHDQYAGQMHHSGWSPAVYDPPKRALSNVRGVYALVLDHDRGSDFDRLVALWSTCSGVVYTTKSHTPEAPRYRSVLALSRPVAADEYAKVWLWAAARCAAAACPVDQQCKDASRFWYDPTVPERGSWQSSRLTGAAIDPDACVPPPVQRPPLRVVPRSATSDSDRVKRARAYLAKLPAAVSGAQGHTATFNAVACVMIGFDLSEQDAFDVIASDYNPRCSPEWSERELRHKIASVAERCKRERGYLLVDRPRIDNTRTAASYAPAARDDLDVDWLSKLLVNEKQKTRKAYHNTAVFVRHHPEFRGRWSLDEMTGAPYFDGKIMDGSMVHYIRAQADCTLGYTPTASDVEAAISAAAKDRPFHPIRQYLRSLDWDGEQRLQAVARDVLATDNPLHGEMVRRWMIGAAARALWPGCKLDTALMLVGDQGYLKSTFFAVLGGQWHADTFIDITNKDGAMQLHAAWIYELAELENVVTGRAESRLKAWITSTHDMYRAPYAKTVERKPRGAAICGSTNRKQFLTDDTGSRRFYIVPVRKMVDKALVIDLRDQLWAEAVCAAEAGEPWWLEPHADSRRERENRQYLEEDTWQEIVMDYLVPPSVTRVTVTDILSCALKLEPGRHGRSEQMRVAKILKLNGWHRERDGGGDRQWFYARPNRPHEDQDGPTDGAPDYE